MSGVMGESATARGEDGWRCLTCQKVFTSPATVRRHWERYSERHSVFRQIATGRLHHQTIEGLQERDWVLPEEPRGHQDSTGMNKWHP